MKTVTLALLSVFLFTGCDRDREEILLGWVRFESAPMPSAKRSDAVKTLSIRNEVWAASVMDRDRPGDPIQITLKINAEAYPETKGSAISYRSSGQPYNDADLVSALAEAFDIAPETIRLTKGKIPSNGIPGWVVDP